MSSTLSTMFTFAMICAIIGLSHASSSSSSSSTSKWKDYPGMTCTDDDNESLQMFEGIRSLSQCKRLCDANKSCNAVTYRRNQKCYLKRSCKKLEEYYSNADSAVRQDSPCKPPVKVYCAKGSTRSKCIEYCGTSLKATQQQQQCGGVVYVCE